MATIERPWDQLPKERELERHWSVNEKEILTGAARKGDEGVPLITVNDAFRMFNRPEIHGGEVGLTTSTLGMLL